MENQFEDILKAKGLGPRTIIEYLALQRSFEMSINDITQDSINHWIADHHYPLAKSFIKHYLLWKGISNISIPKQLGRRAKRIPKYLEQSEIDAMLQYCINTHLAAEEILIRLGFESGLRASEIDNLKPNDIILGDTIMIKVIGKGNREDLVPVKHYTYDIIKTYIKDNNILPEQKIFGHGRKWIWLKIAKVGKESLQKNIWPHRLRHSFAFKIRRKDKDLFKLKRLMRHASITSTEVYSNVTEEEAIDTWKETMGD